MFRRTPQHRVLLPLCRIAGFLTLLGVLTLVSLFSFPSRTARAATQNTINFQARLQNTAGAIVPDGYYNVRFRLYDSDGVSTPGNQLWTEAYYDENGPAAGSDYRVRVANGYLSVALGSRTAFPAGVNWDQNLWLTLDIGGTTQTASPTYDGEMAPRLALSAVPYAFRAGQLAQYNAGTNFTSTLSLAAPTGGNQVFVIPDQGAAGTYNLLTTATANGNYIQNGTTPQAGANFNVAGSGAVGTTFTAGGNINTSGVYQVGGTSGTSTACSTGQVLQNTVVSGGIVTGGSCVTPTTGATLVGAIDSQTKNSNGAVISNSTLYLQTADGSNPGLVSTGTQTFAGAKTFTGNTTIQPAVNSQTALSVQNTAGTQIFSVDTTGQYNNYNVIGNPSYEVAVPTWTAASTIAPTQNLATSAATAANVYHGQASAQVVVSGATANEGVRISSFTTSPTFATSATWTFSIYVKTTVVAATLQLGYNLGAGDVSCASALTLTSGGFSRYNCTITLTSGQTIASIFARTTDGTNRTTYYDGAQLSQGSVVVPFTTGGINLGGVVTSPTSFQSQANSTTAFQVQSAAGNSNNLVVDTINSVVTLGGVVKVAGGSYGGTLNVAGTTITRTSSTSAFQVQTTNGTPILGVDTTAPTANLITNPGFEASTTGWTNKGTGALTRITTPTTALYYGIAAGQLVTGTAANNGVSTTASMTAGITYTLSFYARASGATATGINFGHIASGVDTDCSTNASIGTAGFTRFTCTFVAGTTPTAIYVKQTGTATQTIYLDGFQLLAGSSATPYNLGALQLRGVVNAPLALQNTNDSTTAFQIQNSAGTSNLFVADTLNNSVGVGGNLNIGGNVAVTGTNGVQSTYGFGIATSNLGGGNFSHGATAGTGGVTQNDVVIMNSSAQVVDSTTPRDRLVYGVAGTTAVSGAYVGVITGGNTQVAVDTAAINIGDQLVVSATSGKATVDNAAVSGIIGTALSSKAAGSTGYVYVAVRPVGGQTTPAVQATSTTAFQIQNSNGSGNLFVADTSNGRVGVGVATPAYKLDVAGDVNLSTGSAYRINGMAICTASGCTPSAGSTNYIQNGTTQQASSNFNISGNGTIGGNLTVNGNAVVQSTANSATAFQVQNSSSVALLNVNAATGAMTLQNSSGNTAFVFDASNSHIRVYETGASPTRYADIYYDGTAGEAVYSSSSGATRVGNGSGNVLIQLTNTVDVLQFSKTASLSAAYSANDYTITRNLTAGANAVSGAVLKVESTSTGSAVASTILQLNEANSASTGNLIQATKAGSEVFKLTAAGALSLVGGLNLNSSGITNTGSIAGVTTISGGGGVSLTAAGTNTLALDTTGAGTISLGTNATTVNLGTGTGSETVNIGNSSGNDTVNIATAGGTDTVNVGSVSNPTTLSVFGPSNFRTAVTDSANALRVQDSTGATQFNVDTANDVITLNGSLRGGTFKDIRNVTNPGTGLGSNSSPYQVTTPAFAYLLSTNSTDNAAYNTYYNINVPSMSAEGTVVFMTVTASKSATTNNQNHVTVVQINGTQVFRVDASTSTGTTASVFNSRNAMFVLINGYWQPLVSSLTTPAVNSSSATAADLAEWIPYTGTKPAPGTLLTVGDSAANGARASAKVNSSKTTPVVGVVTSTPAEVYGVDDGHSTPMALAGRVPVRVSLENGPIAPGDYLTQSSVPGVAMRATAPGQMVGMALEGYNGGGDGTVMTQLHPGYAVPYTTASAATLQGGSSAAPSSPAATETAGATTASSAESDGLQTQVSGLQGQVRGLAATLDGLGTAFNTLRLQTGSLQVNGDAAVHGGLNVNGVVRAGGLELAGHFVTHGDRPTLELQSAAGNQHPLAGVAAASASVQGNDISGMITLTTGEDPAADRLLKVAFNKAYGLPPQVVLTPVGRDSAVLQWYVDNTAADSFYLGAGVQPQPFQRYYVNYHVMQSDANE